MLEKLTTAADHRAAQAVSRSIERIAQTPTPPDVDVDVMDTGIILTGKRLRRRMIDDPQLRNFGR